MKKQNPKVHLLRSIIWRLTISNTFPHYRELNFPKKVLKSENLGTKNAINSRFFIFICYVSQFSHLLRRRKKKYRNWKEKICLKEENWGRKLTDRRRRRRWTQSSGGIWSEKFVWLWSATSENDFFSPLFSETLSTAKKRRERCLYFFHFNC